MSVKKKATTKYKTVKKTTKKKPASTTAKSKKAAKKSVSNVKVIVVDPPYKSAAKNKQAVKDDGFDTFSHMNLGRGKATLAIRVKGDDVEVGVSFCSPRDQFSKARGRLLAEGRLNNKRGFYFEFERGREHLKEQAQNILCRIVDKKTYPLVSDLAGDGLINDYSISHIIPRWASRVAR